MVFSHNKRNKRFKNNFNLTLRAGNERAKKEGY